MNNLKIILLITIIFSINIGCENSNQESDLLNSFTNYYDALKSKDDSKWDFTSDTVKVWFEKDDDKPSLRYKNKKIGKWGEWDGVMHSRSYYDSIWYNENLHAIQGFFYESNEFYDLIGASPNKTLRTYSLDESNKITDLLYERIEGENTISNKHMDPIYEWALENDSLEIIVLYPGREFVPSTENALRWKKLLERYNKAKNAL